MCITNSYLYPYPYQICICICTCIHRFGRKYPIVVSRICLATKGGGCCNSGGGPQLRLFHVSSKATVTKAQVLSPCNLLVEAVVGCAVVVFDAGIWQHFEKIQSVKKIRPFRIINIIDPSGSFHSKSLYFLRRSSLQVLRHIFHLRKIQRFQEWRATAVLR